MLMQNAEGVVVLSPRQLRKRMPDEDYDTMLARQGGVCVLCGKKPNKKRRLSRDHDHVTMRLRGLVHARCNHALAPFEWSDEVLTNLVTYVSLIIQDRAEFAAKQEETTNGE